MSCVILFEGRRPRCLAVLLCCFALLAGALAASPARAASLYDSAINWRTILSPRFAVHYPDGARNLAVRVSRIAEEELDRVGALMGYIPAGRIEVVLIDTSDDANGSAQVMPKNIVRIFLTAPTELTGLSSYDDWLRILLTHELTHICDIDQTWGATRFLRAIFGKYIAMNGYVPQFLSEGVAVYSETELTPTGRGRSSYVEMLLRMAAIEQDDFLHIDQANILFPDWPGGNAAYYYGGRFHLWLAERFGTDKVRALHHFFAAQPIPYFYYPGALSVLDDDLPSLWDAWRRDERAYGLDVQEDVRAHGITASKRLTFHGRNITGARYSPDGAYIIYSRTSPVDGSTVRRIDRDGANDHHLVLETFSPRFSFDTSGSFYYSQAAVNDRFDTFNDLYRYDSATGDITQLRAHDAPGVSLRARDPAVSPDGAHLVFVQNLLGQSWLTVATFNDAKRDALTLRTLVAPTADVQHASPAFSPDGKRIAESVWHNGGHRDIVILDALTGVRLQRVTDDDAQDGNPTWSRDGRFVLYESDADGISNIYAFEPGADRFYRVTHVVGGAFQPDVSPDGQFLLFRNASGIGFDIHEMPYDPGSWEPQRYEPAVGYTPMASAAPAPDAAWMHTKLPSALPRLEEAALQLRVSETDEDYSAWRTLLPLHDNWVLIPNALLVNDDPTLSVTTVGQDAVGKHTYTASLGTSFFGRFPNWAVGYSNDVFYPTLGGSFGQSATTYPTTLGPRAVQVGTRGAAGVSLALGQRHATALTYVYDFRRGNDIASRVGLPLGNFSRLNAGYSYNFVRLFPYSISNEHGRSAAVSMSWYSRAVDADFDELLLSGDLRAYINNPLFDNHVLALRLASAMAFGPDHREAFILGGHQGTSLLSVQTASIYSLRGFSPDVGQGTLGAGVLAAYAEYRLPLWQLYRGLWTLPVFVQRFHLAVFFEAGNLLGASSGASLSQTWNNVVDAARLVRAGTGAELRMDITLGWAFPLTLRFGFGAPAWYNGRYVLGAQPVDVYFDLGSSI